MSNTSKSGMNLEDRKAHWQRGHELNEEQLEALGIFQEELAECIQEASKIRRSGPDFVRHNSTQPNLIHFQNEIMDMQILLEICTKLGIYVEPTPERVESYRLYKLERLRNWSKLGEVLDAL